MAKENQDAEPSEPDPKPSPDELAKFLAEFAARLETFHPDVESAHAETKREVPSAITADTLAAIPDDALWNTLWDYVSAWLDRHRDNGRDYAAAEEALPPGLRFVWELAGIEFEVPNGGFEQYFENSTGEYAAKLLEQFKSTGATKRAALLEKAILLFEEKGGRSRDYQERWLGPTPPEKETDKLLDEYLRIAEEDDISAWFAPYVRDHAEVFFHSPIETKDPNKKDGSR